MAVARFQLEDGRVARFEVPDGTSQEDAQRLFNESSQQETQGFLDRPLGERVEGALRGTGNVLSSAVATVGSGLVGLGATALTGDPAAGARAVDVTREAFTTDPGEAGTDFLQTGLSVAKDLSREKLGDTVVDAAGDAANRYDRLATETAEAGNPGVATLIKTLPTAAVEAVPAAFGIRAVGRAAGITPTPSIVSPPPINIKQAAREVADVVTNPQTANKKEVAKLLESGSKEDITATFELVPGRAKGNPRVQTDKEATAAVKQGFSEGSIASLKASTPSTQRNFDRMLNIADRIKKEESFGMRNRPSDVLGDSLMQRVNVLMAANKRAGFSIDRISKSLAGKKVDLSSASDNFSSALGGLGVSLIDNGKGGFKANFENSVLSPGDRGPINEVVRLMNVKGKGESDGFIDGLTAHQMKRAIDNNVTFGAKKTGISGDGANVLKNFRRDIDSVLDNSSPDYNDANVAYSETIGVLNDFQDVAGRKMNLSGSQADKATGTLMRRIAGNAQSRIRLLDSVDAIDAAVKKHGDYSGQKLIGKEQKALFDDELETQVMLANQLDSVVGIAPATSIQGIFDASLARNLAEGAATGGSMGLAIDVGAKIFNKALQRNDKAAIKAARAVVKKELLKTRNP
jgi:hypothetical protein